MKYSRLAFLFIGIVDLVLFVFLAVAATITGDTGLLSENLIWLAMAVMAFCLSYLFPQFIQKDERMKLIRQKGIFFSFFAFLFYSILLTTLLHTNLIQLTGSETISILTSLMICTVFISWVVLSKIY
ncbi:permease [Sediminibacillus dalangtanensis]|uniref:permease n=1 Tax=Sediminibacillus dalangtanensis TaxID=2729421 RepID=UPI001ADEF552|nr:permease [Sediminibacillus dalangtanensis]